MSRVDPLFRKSLNQRHALQFLTVQAYKTTALINHVTAGGSGKKGSGQGKRGQSQVFKVILRSLATSQSLTGNREPVLILGPDPFHAFHVLLRVRTCFSDV